MNDLDPKGLLAALEANHRHKADPGRKGCGIEKAIRAYLSATVPDEGELVERVMALEEALRASEQALCDWLNTYASDLCSPVHVAEAEARIGAKGTIGYIADALQTIRAALKDRKP